ncbi:hypothetical protein CP03DC29_0957A, partial [Chlamydia psittaci 03DC29]
MFGAS